MPRRQRLTDLVTLLLDHQSLWRANPFTDHHPAWLAQYPELGHWLLHLDEESATALESEPDALSRGAVRHLPVLGALDELTRFEPGPRTPLQPVNPRHFSHIPGRKWEQIQAFAAAIADDRRPVLEWCAGKGHLGRLVGAHQQVRVVSLERDHALCNHGKALAQKARVDQVFLCQDALSPGALQAIKPHQHALALHACGDLHLALIEGGIRAGTERLTISPCCYHLTAEPHYRPRSRVAKALGLSLSREELRLAVQEVATAPARVRRQRQQEMGYRLGYQALVEQLYPDAPRQGVPSCGQKALNEGFETFCRHAAAHQSLSLPSPLDWQRLEHQGRARWQRMRRLQLVRQLFRPALEAYLVLDRALWLVEAGYRVTVTRFTERAVTPRNFLIQAELP